MKNNKMCNDYPCTAFAQYIRTAWLRSPRYFMNSLATGTFSVEPLSPFMDAFAQFWPGSAWYKIKIDMLSAYIVPCTNSVFSIVYMYLFKCKTINIDHDITFRNWTMHLAISSLIFSGHFSKGKFLKWINISHDLNYKNFRNMQYKNTCTRFKINMSLFDFKDETIVNTCACIFECVWKIYIFLIKLWLLLTGMLRAVWGHRCDSRRHSEWPCHPRTVGGAPGDTATPDKEHTPPGPVSGPWPQP